MATSISTGVLNADTLIWTGKNRVNAITVLTDGTNAATVDLYDNTSASGKIGAKGKCVGTGLINHIIFENPVLFENGIYADVTGTGATFIVFFGG
jgi:hypothetical protein